MNRTPRRPHGIAASAAALALLSLSFAAHADVASSVDVAIDGLRYHLVDLAPDDGQAPGLTVLDDSLSYSAGIQGGPSKGGVLSIDPLPVDAKRANAGGGTFAEAGPHILATHVRAEGPYRLPSGFEIQPAVYDFVDSRSASVRIWDSPDRGEPQGLVLAPHTQLVFEGTATLSSHASASALLGTDGQPVTTPYQHDVYSHGVMFIKLDTGLVTETPSWSAETNTHARYTLDHGVGTASGPAHDSQTLPFLLTLSNTSDKPLGAYFDWQVVSYSSATATTVPEPPAWALMLAGLAIVPAALAKRAQKRQR